MRAYKVSLDAGTAQNMALSGRFCYVRQATGKVALQFDNEEIIETVVNGTHVVPDNNFRSVRVFNRDTETVTVDLILGEGDYNVQGEVVIPATLRTQPIYQYKERISLYRCFFIAAPVDKTILDVSESLNVGFPTVTIRNLGLQPFELRHKPGALPEHVVAVMLMGSTFKISPAIVDGMITDSIRLISLGQAAGKSVGPILDASKVVAFSVALDGVAPDVEAKDKLAKLSS